MYKSAYGVRPSKLIPYEQPFIQQFFHSGSLIPEQICYYHNPMFKLAHTVDIMSTVWASLNMGL